MERNVRWEWVFCVFGGCYFIGIIVFYGSCYMLRKNGSWWIFVWILKGVLVLKKIEVYCKKVVEKKKNDLVLSKVIIVLIKGNILVNKWNLY